jgi:hypothetical protein
MPGGRDHSGITNPRPQDTGRTFDDDSHREVRIFPGERPLLAQSGRSRNERLETPRMTG